MSDLFSICRFPFRMLALAALLCLNGCDKGEDIENQAPETRISVEAINLSGENRLNSLVEIKWWGTDPDGYVTGYEFSFDGINWHYTLGQDSTFRFAITEGSDTIDIDFGFALLTIKIREMIAPLI